MLEIKDAKKSEEMSDISKKKIQELYRDISYKLSILKIQKYAELWKYTK